MMSGLKFPANKPPALGAAKAPTSTAPLLNFGKGGAIANAGSAFAKPPTLAADASKQSAPAIQPRSDSTPPSAGAAAVEAKPVTTTKSTFSLGGGLGLGSKETDAFAPKGSDIEKFLNSKMSTTSSTKTAFPAASASQDGLQKVGENQIWASPANKAVLFSAPEMSGVPFSSFITFSKEEHPTEPNFEVGGHTPKSSKVKK